MTDLVSILIAHSATARDRLTSAADREVADVRLRKHYATGEAAWPDLPLSDVMFAEAFALHVDTSDSVVPDDLHAADFYLAAACTKDVRGAISALSRAFLSQVPRYIARVCRPSDEEKPEDVAQAIAERVVVPDGERAPRIAAYSGRGPLGGWLRVLSVRMALNAKRGTSAVVLTDEDPSDVPAGFDPELDHFKWRYRDAFKTAFEAAFATLDDNQRLLLRLHSSGSRGDDIATVLGVERSTVMRRLGRAREVLFEATKRRMIADLSVSSTEFESIARALQSNIELTLSRVLAPRASDASDANGVP